MGSQMVQGQWGKEGQMARWEGMEGCMRVRWQLLEVVGMTWGSRWWAGRGQIRGLGVVRGQIGAAMARWGGGVLQARWWGGVLGWDTRQGMGWGSRHIVGFQTGVGSSQVARYQTQVGVPDRDGGVPDKDGGVPGRWWYTRCR